MTDAKKTPAHRCPGCAQHTAPARYMLCDDCADSRPEEDNDEAAGDVGFESGDFC